jgi:hypothetical protein
MGINSAFVLLRSILFPEFFKCSLSFFLRLDVERLALSPLVLLTNTYACFSVLAEEPDLFDFGNSRKLTQAVGAFCPPLIRCCTGSLKLSLLVGLCGRYAPARYGPGFLSSYLSRVMNIFSLRHTIDHI